MTVDPAPFLATIITTSAALVAIIGGLLVARFIGLDSVERSSSKVLTSARERLDVARHRVQTAWGSILRWDADDFFSTPEVVEAVLDQDVASPAELMRLASWPHEPDELAPFVTQVTAEACRAREAITPCISDDDAFWRDLRRRCRDLPEIRWPQVWEHVFEDIARKRAADEKAAAAAAAARRLAAPPRSAVERSLDLMNAAMSRQQQQQDLWASVLVPPPPTDHGAITARRLDDLLADHTRAQQQAEDLEAELLRLEQEHAEIIRPDARLWWGIGILIVFTILGVAIPLGVMTTGPHDLEQVRWVFSPFIVSLLALIGYIVVYLAQLTRSKNDQPTAAGLPRGIPVQPRRSDPAATRPDPRHRPRRRIHRLGRSRPARHRPVRNQPGTSWHPPP